MSDVEVLKEARRNARAEILRVANIGRAWPLGLPDFTGRHIQQAVFKCRQRGLVSAGVLRAAGFRP